MTERQLYDWLIFFELALSPIIFYVLLHIAAPYGRHLQKKWGPQLNFKIGWFLMEFTAALSFAVTFFNGQRSGALVPLIFFTLWQIHYLDRSILYLFRSSSSGKQMPAAVLVSGVVFNALNGYINARFLSEFGPAYDLEWLADGRFIMGMLLFAGGFFINRSADQTLFNLRKNEDKGYKIPQGVFFNYVSCPNYLGEIIEWGGWALAAWSLPGLAFAVFTAANLAPRALAHHRWYKMHFPDYPSSRKAIIPFIL